MADISKLGLGPVEKPGVPARVAGGRFAAGANNIASAKDGGIGVIGANNTVASRDRSFLYQDYAERTVEEHPGPDAAEDVETLPAIDGSGLNKAPILDSPAIDPPPPEFPADLATRATGSYQSVANTQKPLK